ncbi:phosphoglycolate phosphatase [Oryzibacter oryziterrae]|uniref:phosphoglycolate phosphatase n=1 Tax=Oryzibacter oryziterrae TaxID=2766474 RepID=UPI001EEE72C4|nr:phosphoglycolate phosphatase [Oryzibacter oryziterrae]
MARPLVIFDLDGTLLDTAPDLLRALNTVLAEAGMPAVDRSSVEYNFGHGAKSLIVEGFRRAGHALSDDEVEPYVRRFLDLYAAGVAVDTEAFPGAVAAMDRLADRGVGFAVCTNKREYLARPLLRQLDLLDRFDAVIGGDTLPVRKPDPQHILSTIEAAAAEVTQAVMVGDSDADIKAAKAAGIPVIGVNFGYSPVPVSTFEPDAVIDHFDDLYDALQQVSPAFRTALG